MESVLASITDKHTCQVLFEHLLELELSYRSKVGKCPTEVEYTSRFPEFLDTVVSVFSRRPEFPGLPAAIGQYRVEKEIGRGGMGIVYKATHPVLQKHVAVKVLSRRYIDCIRARSRFDREMKIVGQLDNPHVVRILDGGEFEGGPFFVMELVEGNDLASLLQRLGPFPSGAACEIIRQAAQGLQAIHQCGLVHRDLKPANLMLTPDGVVRILDFGLTVASTHRKAADGAHDALTTQNTVLGTLEYMSPEQIEQSSEVDIRSDIYSLGATLYGLLAGESPYANLRGQTPVRKIIRISGESPASLRLQRPEVPAAVISLVEKMMARNPSDRFADPGKVLRAIQPQASLDVMKQFITSAAPYNKPLNAVTEDLERGETVTGLRMENQATRSAQGTGLGNSADNLPEPYLRSVTESTGFRRNDRLRKLTAVVASLTLVSILCAVVYIRTNRGVLRVEILDPEVTVTVSGSDVVLKGAGAEKELVVTPGTKVFMVRRREFEFEAGELILRRGEVKTVSISVFDKVIEVREKDGRLIAQQPVPSDAGPPSAGNPAVQTETLPQLFSGNELHFSGNESIEVPSLKLRSKADYTMECWIMETQGSAGRRGGLAVGFHGVSFLAISQEKRWRWQFQRRTPLNIVAIPALSEPAHYACVREGNIHRLFINGKMARDMECRTPDSGDVPLTIGRDFIGRLDEIRISRVARYREEFTPAKRFESDSDTLALYHCDDEQTGVFSDSSGNRHNGVIMRIGR